MSNRGFTHRGVLVTNAFLRTEKFTEHYEWLRKAAQLLGMELEQKDNAEEIFCMGASLDWLREYDFIVYWDKDIAYGRQLSEYADTHNIKIYNTVDAVAACDDKFETYYRLSCWNHAHPDKRIPLLPTIMAPMTYGNIGYTNLYFLEAVENTLGYPVVVKECFGSFGQQVYMAQDRQELERLTKKLAGKPFLYQKYAASSRGRDVRMQVVGERVAAAMERRAIDGDFRANITNGGTMKPYAATAQEQNLAVRVAGILGLDFAGVDLLFGENGLADIVCEVNSNAHFKNIYNCTGVDVAEQIMRHIFCDLQQNAQAEK